MLCTDNLSPSDMRNGSFQQIADSTKQTTTMTSPVDKHTTEKTDSSYLVSILFSSHALQLKDVNTFLFIFTENEEGEIFL